MAAPSKSPAMSQKIFTMGFSVEQVSVYLLCCGLTDSGQDISTAKLLEIWNGTEQALIDGLKTLTRHNILLQVISDSEANAVYRVLGPERWAVS